MDASTPAATTTTSYATNDPEAMSQTQGRRRPTIRDIAAGGSSFCLTEQHQQQHPQQHPPHPSTQVASITPCWFVDSDAAEEPDPSSASPWQQPHFLDECRMCGRHLSRDQDIYMYKGDTPFCSEECRDEQIQMDHASERSRRRRRAVATDTQVLETSQADNAAAVVAVGAV